MALARLSSRHASLAVKLLTKRGTKRALAAATYVACWWLTNYGQVSDPIDQNVWDLWRKRWERCYEECEQRGLDYHRMFASLEEADAYLKMRKDLSHAYHIGTVMPSVFAVLRLMTSSNLLDCTTGKSPGFSPLRIFPT
jgi:hypothetical protein